MYFLTNQRGLKEGKHKFMGNFDICLRPESAQKLKHLKYCKASDTASNLLALKNATDYYVNLLGLKNAAYYLDGGCLSPSIKELPV